jgi:hypothetical protein
VSIGEEDRDNNQHHTGSLRLIFKIAAILVLFLFLKPYAKPSAQNTRQGIVISQHLIPYQELIDERPPERTRKNRLDEEFGSDQ